MKNKKVIISILGSLLCVLLFWLGFYLYENQSIVPGIEGLSKKNVGVFYCSYNDDVATVANTLKDIVNAKTVEIKTAEPYSTDLKQFNERISKENQNLSRVVLQSSNLDLTKYDYLIFATPIINNRACPAIQRFILDKYTEFEKKPVSVVVLYKDGELPGNTLLFFTRKLALSVWKPPYVSGKKNPKKLNSQVKMWLNRMHFKRKELRH